MMHWTSDFYTRIDRGDTTLAELFATDVRAQVSNKAETRGVFAMMAGELGRHARVAPTCTHVFRNIWDLDESTAAVESIVTFDRTDGRKVTINALAVVHRNEQHLNDGLRIYIDNSPLFEDVKA